MMPTHNSTPASQKKPDRPHLLVFCPLYPPHIGGLESHAEQWNLALAALGYNITVFTPRVVSSSPEKETPRTNLTILRFPAWEIIPNYPIPAVWHPAFWRLWQQIDHPPNTIIISRTRFFLTTPLTYLVSRLSGRPWLHIEHGADHVQSQNRLIYHLARLSDLTLGRFLLRKADKIVANSKASATFVKHLAPTTNPQVIYRGVELDKIAGISPANPKTYNLKESSSLITYLGRLIDGKGFSDLLQAFANLKHPPAHLLIIGTGPQEQQLKRQATDLNIHDQVTFLGPLPWQKAIALLKASDIVVNPSYSEGLPTTIIEAALCQKAVVATNVGGTPEIITHNHSGLLYPAGDAAALTTHLQALINNPQIRQQLAQQAHKDTQNRFAWKASIPHYETLLTNLTQTST